MENQVLVLKSIFDPVIARKFKMATEIQNGFRNSNLFAFRSHILFYSFHERYEEDKHLNINRTIGIYLNKNFPSFFV